MADRGIREIARPWERRGIRVTPVISDTMEPTIMNGDFVLAVPSKGEGEGIYIFSDGSIYRVSGSRRQGPMILTSDNKRYSQHEVTREWLDENIVAYVVAYTRVLDGRFLRPA